MFKLKQIKIAFLITVLTGSTAYTNDDVCKQNSRDKSLGTISMILGGIGMYVGAKNYRLYHRLSYHSSSFLPIDYQLPRRLYGSLFVMGTATVYTGYKSITKEPNKNNYDRK